METTEKIVEAYRRFIKGWFTLTNLKGPSQSELGRITIDTTKKNRYKRYHIDRRELKMMKPIAKIKGISSLHLKGIIAVVE